MASMTNSLLRKILVKYAGVPNQEAVLVANELDEIRKYDTAAALLADVANVSVGSFAYAIDTGTVYLKNATAFILVAAGNTDGNAFLQAKVTLAYDDIVALVATPFELVAAVAGKVVMPYNFMFQMVTGSEVFTESADNMIVNWVDAAGIAATGAIEATGLIDAAANAVAKIESVAVPVGLTAELVNTPLILDNTGDGEYAGNATEDGILNVWTNYALIDVD